jgi:pyridoxamine 5'-phosphate oxidase family protein
MFTEAEEDYLHGQRLARLGTASSGGQVDVAPVGYEFDGWHFYIGGRDLRRTLKYKNVLAGNTLVSLAVDDLASIEPWKPRGVKLHGTADIVEREGRFGRREYIRVTPSRAWSWGIEGPVFVDGRFAVRKAGTA